MTHRFVWNPASPQVREFSAAVFGSMYRLPVMAGIARFDGDVFTYYDLSAASGVQYQDVRIQLRRLEAAGLVELVDGRWQHYWRAVDSPLWAAARDLLAEVDEGLPGAAPS